MRGGMTTSDDRLIIMLTHRSKREIRYAPPQALPFVQPCPAGWAAHLGRSSAALTSRSQGGRGGVQDALQQDALGRAAQLDVGLVSQDAPLHRARGVPVASPRRQAMAAPAAGRGRVEPFVVCLQRACVCVLCVWRIFQGKLLAKDRRRSSFVSGRPLSTLG